MAARWMIVVGAAIVFLAIVARFGVIAWAAGHIHTLEETPERRVAIVFGAQVYPSGHLSAMLADRVATGADLYHQGKVDVLLMTGDNRTLDYNEPAAMREYALSLGVPDEAIVLDYGGRRTYDSCYRAYHIFGVTDAIAVTQQFHLSRAVMTCSALGIDAVGVAADYQRPAGYRRSSLNYSQIRELPATANALIDLLRKNQPPVMGEPLPIFPHEG